MRLRRNRGIIAFPERGWDDWEEVDKLIRMRADDLEYVQGYLEGVVEAEELGLTQSMKPLLGDVRRFRSGSAKGEKP